MLKIAAASDHAGLDLKLELLNDLQATDYEVVDLGTHSQESVDYPDFGKAVGEAVAKGEADWGLCVCGSGIGIAIAANKVAGVRAAVIHDVTSARLSRAHNDANVICLGARLVGAETARDSLRVFLETEFEGGRHAPRVQKLNQQG